MGGVGSAIGALIGHGLGVLQAGIALEFSLLSAGLVASPLVSWGPVALVGGTVLTVVSALYPTYVAARLSPVEAMRVEV